MVMGCIVQRSQPILPHIPHLGGVLFHARENEPDIGSLFQFHQLASNHFGRFIISCDADHFPMAARCIHQQLLHLPQHIFIVRIGCNYRIQVI